VIFDLTIWHAGSILQHLRSSLKVEVTGQRSSGWCGLMGGLSSFVTEYSNNCLVHMKWYLFQETL